MSDFQNFMLQQARKETAYERFNYATAALELATIRERLAEIASQHEPLATLISAACSERDRLCAAARYVVTGRTDE
jgi:hypothetical protein